MHCLVLCLNYSSLICCMILYLQMKVARRKEKSWVRWLEVKRFISVGQLWLWVTMFHLILHCLPVPCFLHLQKWCNNTSEKSKLFAKIYVDDSLWLHCVHWLWKMLKIYSVLRGLFFCTFSEDYMNYKVLGCYCCSFKKKQ